MTERTADTGQWMAVFRDLLSQGKDVVITITGNSMSPFLIHGRDRIQVVSFDGIGKRGDMALFQRKNGQYVMHRIYRVMADGSCYFIGDAQQQIEGPVLPEQIFGKVIKAERKGKWLSSGSFWWEFFAHIWIRIVPLRPFCRKLYGFWKNMKGRSD